MKKTLLLVFGAFVLVIGLFTLFSYTITQKLHNNHLQLLQIDQIAETLQKHKEQLLEYAQQSSLFDSVACKPQDYALKSTRFFDDFRDKCAVHFTPGNNLFQKIGTMKKDETLLYETVQQLGFKECGVLGEMRKSIHYVENNAPQLEKSVLELRRHEKDYFMRLDDSYALKHAGVFEKLITQNPNNKELRYYNSNFIDAQLLLGLLYGNPQAHFEHLIASTESLQAEIRANRSKLLQQNSLISSNYLKIQLVASAIIIILIILIGFWCIRRLAGQVQTLQTAMSSFIASNYKERPVEFLLPKNELGILTKRFYQLARKIQHEVTYLEERVHNRTLSLRNKNELLEQQHTEIVESLNYAQNLQKSLLVSQRKIGLQFQEAYVHYAPKNLVGGDFYWMKEFKRGNSEFVLFALADCTGHGVPGALISVLGMNTLDELYSNGLNNPANLLNQLRSIISRRFNTETEQRLDGMDISIFLLNKRTGKLTFSGAQMPLWIIKNQSIIELKGQRSPIGLTYGIVEPFFNQVIQLDANDKILLFTDGLTDQFGAKNQKKWGKKGLRVCLHESTKLSTSAIFHSIVDNYENWKKDNDQTDDCALLLFEFQHELSMENVEGFAANEIQNENIILSIAQ